MSKLMEVTRCRRLCENRAGRDFVVGDLHGHRLLLLQALEAVRFDPSRDRVLSVGDLINRGPESLETLALIEEPWFHAVLGNHELLLLSHLGFFDSRLRGRKPLATGSGAWVVDALRNQRKRLRRLAERVASLPLALHVEGAVPCNVMHGDLTPLGDRQDVLFAEPTLDVHEADRAASSRAHIGRLCRRSLRRAVFAGRAVHLGNDPGGGLPLTYVGHSPIPEVTVHGDYVYIDQGLGARSARRPLPALPTLLEHRRFAAWIGALRPRPLAPPPAVACRASRDTQPMADGAGAALLA